MDEPNRAVVMLNSYVMITSVTARGHNDMDSDTFISTDFICDHLCFIWSLVVAGVSIVKVDCSMKLKA